jgi:hypothetical protein
VRPKSVVSMRRRVPLPSPAPVESRT